MEQNYHVANCDQGNIWCSVHFLLPDHFVLTSFQKTYVRLTQARWVFWAFSTPRHHQYEDQLSGLNPKSYVPRKVMLATPYRVKHSETRTETSGKRLLFLDNKQMSSMFQFQASQRAHSIDETSPVLVGQTRLHRFFKNGQGPPEKNDIFSSTWRLLKHMHLQWLPLNGQCKPWP